MSLQQAVDHYVKAWTYKEHLPLVQETTTGGCALSWFFRQRPPLRLVCEPQGVVQYEGFFYHRPLTWKHLRELQAFLEHQVRFYDEHERKVTLSNFVEFDFR
jgi:hypothetical protein